MEIRNVIKKLCGLKKAKKYLWLRCYKVFLGAVKYFISFQDKDSAVLLGIQKRSYK